MSLYDVVIVGSGPSGMTAAIYAARANMKVLLLDRLAPGGQIINTNEIQNYTGVGTINGAELAMNMFEHTQELNVEFDYATVTKIEADGDVKKVYIEEDSDRIIETKTVIIATGTEHRKLNVENEDMFIGNGIGFCAICDGEFYRDKDVVVIGGGNSAVEESIYLADIVKTLTIITMYDLTADPIACDKLRSMPNVTVYTYQDVLGFVGEGSLSGVKCKSSQTGEEMTVNCDGVFEYIGLSPVTAFVSDLGITNERGYIEVNHRMETKIPGI